jgi:hypothetical protein
MFATNAPLATGQKIVEVSLLGYDGKLEWSQKYVDIQLSGETGDAILFWTVVS